MVPLSEEGFCSGGVQHVYGDGGGGTGWCTVVGAVQGGDGDGGGGTGWCSSNRGGAVCVTLRFLSEGLICCCF